MVEANECGAVVESYREGKMKLLVENPTAVSPHLPQITDKLENRKDLRIRQTERPTGATNFTENIDCSGSPRCVRLSFR